MKTLFRALIAAAVLVAGPALADEAAIKKAVEEKLGGKVDSVSKSGFLGLYEVYAEGNIFYTDEKVSAIVAGNLIDTRNMQNVTQERLQKLSAIKFSELPLDLAVKTVRGKGSRVFATFEDPNCGYCKRLGKELAQMDDVTVYTFLYPILSEDSRVKSDNIWCAKDKGRAWTDWVVDGKEPAKASCDTATITRNVELGQSLRISGTPTIFLADGSRIGGYLPRAELEKAMDAAKR